MNKVLIIDDEPWARQVVKSLGDWTRLDLVIAGEAEDGKEGLRLIRELGPHIVLTDMRMPGVDGVELLKQINSQFPLLKIIVMSGYDDFMYLKQAIRSRAVEYLLKPVDPDELNAALEKCIFELQTQKQTVNTAWDSPLVFPDTPSMNRYVALRQRVFAALFELSKPAILQALSKLEEFLRTTFPEGLEPALIRKIGDDFLRILEEFMLENEAGFKFHPASAEDHGQLWTNVPDTIAAIQANYAEAIDKIEALRKTKSRLVISEVKDYMDKHFLEPITLETVANKFYISKEHLSRAFKTAAGENLTEYIIRKRMERARELLLQPHISIKEAALMTGYTELAYFHRVFKKHFGRTPGEMRSGKK
ncbi:response regulator [Paenibacillus sp. BR2-3]|uniref:response regulator n=1 Tax=Paenibacillus sp. BR2-3 TaxID=3048494 RepID=UPI00397781B7